jgi:hypothetical protein
MDPIGATERPRSAGQSRLAVLIDADNAQASVVEAILDEVARYGVASVKRIYGDWTEPALGKWKKSLLEHSIQPVQQFAYTRGKNATDSALIIDAMDLLYTRRFDGFCLVSSDSDFTRLAQRLREEGMSVYGFGERKTPAPFLKACDKFIYTDLLVPADVVVEPLAAAALPLAKSVPTPAPTSAQGVKASRAPKAENFPSALVQQAISEADDDSGWAHLGAVGSYLTKIRPEFDARLYGHKKLSDLLRSRPGEFLLEERGVEGSPSKTVYVRLAVEGPRRKS